MKKVDEAFDCDLFLIFSETQVPTLSWFRVGVL